MSKVMPKLGEVVQEQPMMYKAVVQMLFQYGSDRCVAMASMLMVKEGFHHRVAR